MFSLSRSGIRAAYSRAAVSALTAASLVLPVAASAAEDHPPLMPSHDAVVTYEVQPDGAGQPQHVKVWFAAEGARMRIDSGDGAASTVLDRTAQTVMIVLNGPRVYSRLTDRTGVRNPFLLDVSMQYRRLGSATIAGIDCTRWSVTSPQGQASACVTENGLILSEDGVDADGLKGRLKAISVSYDTIPTSTFEPPEGYQEVHRRSVPPAGAPSAPAASGDTAPNADAAAVPDAATPSGPAEPAEPGATTEPSTSPQVP